MKSSLVGHNEFGILIPKDGPSGDVSWANRYLNYGERRGKSVTETKCVCWGEGKYCYINIKLNVDGIAQREHVS